MSKCTHRHLVSSDVCRIRYCADCGVVHLALGAMTLHLTSDQFAQFAQSLHEASRRKREIDSPPAEQSVADGVVLKFPGMLI